MTSAQSGHKESAVVQFSSTLQFVSDYDHHRGGTQCLFSVDLHQTYLQDLHPHVKFYQARLSRERYRQRELLWGCCVMHICYVGGPA